MASTLAITVEGVLADGDPANFPNLKPITEGLALYHSFKTMFKLALVSSCENEDMLKHWCLQQGLKEHPYTVWQTPQTPTRGSQWAWLRNHSGLDVGMVVDADPANIKDAFINGYFGLLFVQTAYARPEWRPDFEGGPTPWDDLTAAVEQARLFKNLDPRRDADLP